MGTSPPHQFVKLNFDGFVIQNKHAASGFVICDSSGYPLLASSKNLGSSNVLVAEALALRDGLIQASSAGFNKIEV